MKTGFWIFISLISISKIVAQERVVLPGEILSAVKSADDSLVAVTTVDSVYILGVANFSIKSRWKHDLEAPSVYGFHPFYKNILLLRQHNLRNSQFSGGLVNYGFSTGQVLKNYLRTDRKYSEQPADSISMWDMNTGRKARSFTGSFFMQFGNTANSIVGMQNLVYDFQSQGRTVYASKYAEIVSRAEDIDLKTQVERSCRKLVLSPDNKFFAASFRDGYFNDTLYFSFRVLDFKTHQEVIILEKLRELPEEFCFSNDGKLIAVAGEWETKGTSAIRIIDLSNAKLVSEIPDVEKISNLEFSKDGKEIYYLNDEREWFSRSIQSAGILQRIWTKITNLEAFKSAFYLNGKVLLIGESWPLSVGIPSLADKTFKAELFSINDMSVYTHTEAEKWEPYADSLSYVMVMNDVADNNSDPVLRFSSDKRIFSSVEGSQLQVWESVKKRKLLQKGFEKGIKVFPDDEGRDLLVIEDKIQKSYNEFTLHLLAMENSTIKTRLGMTAGEFVMNGSYYQCDCVPVPEKSATWICTDGSEQIWQVNGLDFSMKPIVSLKGVSISKIQTAENGSLFLMGEGEDKKAGIWHWERTGTPVQIIASATKKNMSVVLDELWLWNEFNDPVVEIWKKGLSLRRLEFPGPLDHVDVSADKQSILVQYGVKSRVHLQRYIKGSPQPVAATDLILEKFYMLHEDELLSEEEGFSSHYKNAGVRIPWAVKTPKVLDNTNFDVSAHGKFVLFNNRILDLKEIEQWDIYKFSNAVLLQDTGRLEWLEIFERSNYGDEKAGFTLMKRIQGQQDTVKSSTWINVPPKADYISYNHDVILVSPDRQWAFTYTRSFSLNPDALKAPPMIWNLKNMTGMVLPGKQKDFSAKFTADSRRIILEVMEWDKAKEESSYEIFEYSVSPAKLLRSGDARTFGNIEKEDQFKIGYSAVEWYQPEGNSMKLRKSFYSRDNLNKVIYHEGTQKIFAGTGSGSLVIWDKNGSSSPVMTLKAHSGPVVRMVLRGDRLFTMAANGEIGITDISESRFKVLIKTLEKDEELRIAMSTPEGYFRVDPDLISHLHFVRNDSIFPLSSFELQGNRPDRVYAAIGLSDSSLINALKQSWEARIRRAGFDPEQNLNNNVRPVVNWNRDKLPAVSDHQELKLNIAVLDKNTDLKTLFLKINGVPVSGRKGFLLPEGIRNFNWQPAVLLNEGQNQISMIAVNEKGQESLEVTHEIYYEPEKKAEKILYYIGVGVSRYKDSLMNLRFAAKDVEDIARRIEYEFDSIQVLTLLNEKATQENIISVKNFLERTKTDDVVMLSFSGHGLIEKDKGFFFAPHEMDFSDPSAKGVSMEMIEDLLDNIPARRRLLLMDACHSGEEWNTAAVVELPPGVSATALRGIKVRKTGESATAANRNSYLLMKELFSDFSRGNGAFMISAAASNEYAFEGDDWKNGVFTKSFLESLSELRRKKGYFSGDQPRKVRDLRRMIYEKVSKLTNGLQNPTSRQENGWWNWSF